MMNIKNDKALILISRRIEVKFSCNVANKVVIVVMLDITEVRSTTELYQSTVNMEMLSITQSEDDSHPRN